GEALLASHGEGPSRSARCTADLHDVVAGCPSAQGGNGMTPTEPPLMATWLLEHIGRKNPSLAGDLLEEYRQGRSVAWYWRQVLIAIVLRPSKAALLVVGLFALYRLGAHVPIPG